LATLAVSKKGSKHASPGKRLPCQDLSEHLCAPWDPRAFERQSHPGPSTAAGGFPLPPAGASSCESEPRDGRRRGCL